MSAMDRIKNLLKSHPDQTRQAIDKGGDHVDKKTRGRHRRQVDTAQEKAREEFGDSEQDR